MAFNKPVFGTNEDQPLRVENPDGTFLGSPSNHNLYDSQLIREPTIPGDFDRNLDVYPDGVTGKPRP